MSRNWFLRDASLILTQKFENEFRRLQCNILTKGHIGIGWAAFLSVAQYSDLSSALNSDHTSLFCCIRVICSYVSYLLNIPVLPDTSCVSCFY